MRRQNRQLGSVMTLDAGKALKRSMLCPHSNKDYYLTLLYWRERRAADLWVLMCVQSECGYQEQLDHNASRPTAGTGPVHPISQILGAPYRRNEDNEDTAPICLFVAFLLSLRLMTTGFFAGQNIAPARGNRVRYFSKLERIWSALNPSKPYS
jgi:hypothetical protein